jgi:hypothetical protein
VWTKQERDDTLKEKYRGEWIEEEEEAEEEVEEDTEDEEESYGCS